MHSPTVSVPAFPDFVIDPVLLAQSSSRDAQAPTATPISAPSVTDASRTLLPREYQETSAGSFDPALFNIQDLAALQGLGRNRLSELAYHYGIPVKGRNAELALAIHNAPPVSSTFVASSRRRHTTPLPPLQFQFMYNSGSTLLSSSIPQSSQYYSTSYPPISTQYQMSASSFKRF